METRIAPLRRGQAHRPRLICTIVLAALLTSTLAFASDANPLVGVWKTTYAGADVTLKLNADGTGSLNDKPFQWRDEQGFYILAPGDGVATEYNCQLSNDTLVLSGGNLPATLTFTRETTPTEPTTPPAGLGGLLPGADHTPAMTDAAHPSFLLGDWDIAETHDGICFDADGAVTYQGQTFRWCVKENRLYILSQDGQISEGVITLSPDKTAVMLTYSCDGHSITKVLVRPEAESHE